MAQDDARCTVLVVCTANICRSPMAAALLRNRLGARIQVHSAGLHAVGGPADARARQVMAARGIAIGEHLSKEITTSDIAEATLVLTMERAHVAEITASIPRAFSKTFGLTEIVALGEEHGRRRPDETIGAWLGRIHGDRSPGDVLRGGAAFDIPDPHGGSLAGYERCADQLTILITALVDLLEPLAASK